MSVTLLIIIDILLHVHMLTPLFGMLFPGIAIVACGPDLKYQSYFSFYYFIWSIMHVSVALVFLDHFFKLFIE